jgi:hypothetical protein
MGEGTKEVWELRGDEALFNPRVHVQLLDVPVEGSGRKWIDLLFFAFLEDGFVDLDVHATS